MPASLSSVQTEQWSWILSTLWSWIWDGLSWILDVQALMFGFTLFGESSGVAVLKTALLFLPAAAVVAGLWGTMVSLYTVPFRSGRGRFLAAVLMSWWDVLRMIWFYWAGIVRFFIVLLGWLGGLLKLSLQLVWRTIQGAAKSPFALLDWTARKYFQPGVPWVAFFLLLLWIAIEATIFTFTLRPTLNELLTDLTGYAPHPLMLSALLWLFLALIIGGSFALIQVLAEAVRSREIGHIVLVIAAEVIIAFFEVLFLYRELIDAITPWLAQQGFVLGVVGTLLTAFVGWLGVRIMTWMLFGRFGTPAMVAVLARQTLTREQAGVPGVAPPPQPDLWRAPINALKSESEWFKRQTREVFELISLPVLQLLAAGFNFGVVVLLGRPHFTLPFRSLDDVLAATPLVGASKAAAEEAR
ncbi:MAG: hypothetical protein ACREMR_11830 [Gemmatimonadales bacterium]